jgi:hypothetical protein
MHPKSVSLVLSSLVTTLKQRRGIALLGVITTSLSPVLDVVSDRIATTKSKYPVPQK